MIVVKIKNRTTVQIKYAVIILFSKYTGKHTPSCSFMYANLCTCPVYFHKNVMFVLSHSAYKRIKIYVWM